MMKPNITNENIESTFEYTRFLSEDCFPRLTGASGNLKATAQIEKDMDKVCDKTSKQIFTHHPEAFMKILPWTSIMFYATLILFIFDMVTFSLVLYIIVITMYVSQIITYTGLFDKFFKKQEGVNVIGTIEPEGEVKQQIILTGHHDAPYVSHIIEKWPKIYALVMASAILMAVLGLVGSLLWQIDIVFTGIDLTDHFVPTFKIIMYSGAIFMLPFFVFTTRKVSPGAGDNAIAVGLIMEMAKKYGTAKKLGNNQLKHTRLVIVALDGEECGLRGARAFVKYKAEEFQKIKTYNFNIDSIYTPDTLHFFTRDLNSFVRLSKDEAIFSEQLAKDLGYSITLSQIPFGGGATDAAEFVRAGAVTVSLVGIDADVIGHSMDYHTERDTMAVISKKSIQIILEVLDSYIQTRDELLQQI